MGTYAVVRDGIVENLIVADDEFVAAATEPGVQYVPYTVAEFEGAPGEHPMVAPKPWLGMGYDDATGEFEQPVFEGSPSVPADPVLDGEVDAILG